VLVGERPPTYLEFEHTNRGCSLGQIKQDWNQCSNWGKYCGNTRKSVTMLLFKSWGPPGGGAFKWTPEWREQCWEVHWVLLLWATSSRNPDHCDFNLLGNYLCQTIRRWVGWCLSSITWNLGCLYTLPSSVGLGLRFIVWW
jgi:hypothetical protein